MSRPKQREPRPASRIRHLSSGVAPASGVGTARRAPEAGEEIGALGPPQRTQEEDHGFTVGADELGYRERTRALKHRIADTVSGAVRNSRSVRVVGVPLTTPLLDLATAVLGGGANAALLNTPVEVAGRSGGTEWVAGRPSHRGPTTEPFVESQWAAPPRSTTASAMPCPRERPQRSRCPAPSSESLADWFAARGAWNSR